MLSSIKKSFQVLKQDVPRQEDGTLHFLFLVKFFPEDVEEELIQVRALKIDMSFSLWV